MRVGSRSEDARRATAPVLPRSDESVSRRTWTPTVQAWASRIPLSVWATLGYGIWLLVLFREGIVAPAGQWPEGTNVLDSSLQFWYLAHHPTSMWLSPYTDWGQPFPGFTGPTLLTPAILWIDPSTLPRIVEAASFLAAGLSTFAVVRRLNGTPLASFVAGFYYMFMAETSQFFEGHVPAMISLALAPAFFYATFRLFESPSYRRAITSAFLLYLLVSIGDVGILYFLLFFAIPAGIYAAVRRNIRQIYARRELLPLAVGAVIFTTLVLSWALPYALGARPLYTTNITVNILPFGQTTGENAVLAFAGYVADNSFIHFTYNSLYYWPGGLAALPIFALLPVALTLYTILSRRPNEILALGSAFVALVFATGHIYPGFSTFNLMFFDYVPYFNAIPAVFRWVEYTILVYAFLLGRLLSAIERDLRLGGPWFRRAWDRLYLRWLERPPGPLPRPVRWALDTPRRSGPLFAILAVVIVGITLTQNTLVLTRPPGFFTYPSAYTDAFPYIADRPVYGEQLMIPFGGIYDRAPWGGVSSSAGAMGPFYSGADTVIFQAGTPYSLALDQFIGNGIAFTLSRNMTKFLEAVNVQYIVATSYTDWNYSSSVAFEGAPFYRAFQNQSGLPAPVDEGPLQRVYPLWDFTGNVSFHPTYFLTFGDQGMLYSILDEPWYASPGPVFVDGDNITVGLDLFVQHAALIIVSVDRLSTLPASVVVAAESFGIPIILVGDSPTAHTSVYPPLGATAEGCSRHEECGNAAGPSYGVRGNPQMPAMRRLGGGSVPFRSPQNMAFLPESSAQEMPASHVPMGWESMIGLPNGSSTGESNPSFSIFERYLQPQPSPTDQSFTAGTSGWGIVLAAQSYSPLWELSGGPGTVYHAVSNIGLNGWLVNTSVSSTWHVTYAGDRLEATAFVLEGGVGLGMVGVAVVALYTRNPRPRRLWSHP